MVCSRCNCIIIIEVHGHYQCADCGLYVSECCQGETAENDEPE